MKKKLSPGTPGRQRGSFVLGLIVGLLVGLALALGVALYIAKVPVPFVNKVPQRTAEQDAAEAEKNKNWDPNSSLYSKVPPRQGGSSSGVVSPPPAGSGVLPPGGLPSTDGATKPDPAAILSGKTPPEASTKPGSDALSYFVQAGAFGRVEDAEAQRAKLAMSGYQAKVTEREQSGRTVYRVRLGPFDKKEEAAQVKEKLESTGVESALVQVQK
ncbi:SPOR domain-containing protein [Piscinibacter sp. HJYY11]|uniref:SPOR domain-containing protein n=1 Tax=Piscinibacter sp. HJYY11 TaxID=2801333 RepID=UPI00191FA2AE|nr:SPOR domain-containing protein [Piscinibacter sp. HJYY11]MBL0728782.1 SPOR domain-containing protein [Piscinibacter sp. HJYY11]